MTLICLLLIGAIDGGVPSRIQTETRPGATGEVSGVVHDDRGAPIAGAKLSFQGGTHHKLQTASAETGADGRFTATGVPSGMYGTSLSVQASGFHPVAHTLELGASALSLDIRMSRPVKLEGTIIAPDATGGALGLIETTRGAPLHLDAHPFGNGSLSANGTFSLEVPEGDYELVWSRPSGTPFHVIVHAPASKLKLTPPKAGIQGQVLSRAGAPLAATEVTVRSGTTPIGHAATDTQGRFVLFGLDDGDYVVEAKGSNRICISQPVKVARGVGKATVRFGAGWELRGQVVDSEGRGQSGVSILVKTVQADGSFGSPCDVRTAETDAEGRFTATDLPNVEVEVTAFVRSEGVKVKAKPGSAPITVSLPAVLPKRTVSGVVLGPDRKPIAGAMVGMTRNFTDEQGRFTLQREEGRQAMVQFYRRCFVRKEVPEQDAAVVVMERRPCLSANVVDAAKKPVSGMHSLEVKRANGTRVSQCNTREVEGDCTLEAELGAVLVTGTLADGRSVSTKVELTTTEKQEVYLVPQ